MQQMLDDFKGLALCEISAHVNPMVHHSPVIFSIVCVQPFHWTSIIDQLAQHYKCRL